MKPKRSLPWQIVLVILMLAAIALPNIFRSRLAARESALAAPAPASSTPASLKTN
jgi:hypothetical protein